ncbi:TraB/GumN family protein [Dysgonomonas sp. 25]|uniref:TraB/GumN family protein n=1 Tax=Dysgonomonas sp. 25 TaxID=2302933 RepID=UPI0013D637EE|nr:TraB/GumN family protein [Dysgonomonas sp. 25]NDV69916.1 TraB/GumN family protein [Dysgonomonas sp. 25]
MKKLFVLLLLISSVLSLSAQRSEKYNGSLLWKVSGNGLKEASYILGSHHLASLSVLDNIKGLDKAQSETRQVAGELVLADKTDLQNRMMQRAMLPAGESYKTYLSEADYNKLDKDLKAIFGTGLDQMGVMHPGIISLSASIMFYTKAFPDVNLMAHIAIDEHMQKVANETGKTVIGLETVEDELTALFDAEPLKTQAEQLVCTISSLVNEKEKSIAQVKELNNYYGEGNLVKMYDLSFNNPDDPCPSSEEAKNSILRDRNNKWLKQMPAIMKGKPTLFVVGALHLAGEEGLLYQLDKMGYKVEIVK